MIGYDGVARQRTTDWPRAPIAEGDGEAMNGDN